MPKPSFANRVVLGLHITFLVAAASSALIATVNHSLPASWQKTAAAGGVLLGAIAGMTVAVTKFLDGAQKSEALQAAVAAPVTKPEAAVQPDGPA